MGLLSNEYASDYVEETAASLPLGSHLGQFLHTQTQAVFSSSVFLFYLVNKKLLGVHGGQL